MKVIRQDIFESNSSSQHSICVTKNDVHVKPEDFVYNEERDEYPDEYIYISSDGDTSNGNLRLYHIDEGYGRYPFMMLTTFKDKLKYALCEYLGPLYEDDPLWEPTYNEFKEIVKEVLPGFEDFRFDTKDVDLYVDKDGNDILTKDLRYDGWDSENNSPKYYYLDKFGNKQPAIFNEEDYMEMPRIGMIDHQSMGMLKNFIKDSGISLKEFLTNKKYVIIVDGDEYETWETYKRSGMIDLDFIVSEYDKSGEDVRYQKWLEEQKVNEESNER